MALYGTQRDISLFRHLNRELMGDIITQQCAFYKFKIEETKVNLYGEAADEKYYMGPVLLNCLIERQNEEHPIDDFGTGFKWDIVFKFLRDDLLGKAKDFNQDWEGYGADLVPDVGDIILFEKGYRSVRGNKVLKSNYIWSIYKKGKIRENRIKVYKKSYSHIKLEIN